MSEEFVESFKQLLIAEFACSTDEADRIARHADRHQRNTGIQRTPNEWVEVLIDIEAETVVQRWKTAIEQGMADNGA